MISAAVQERAEEILRSRQVMGLVIGVQRGGRAPELLVVGSDATGMALEGDTLFSVASITKLATALAVLALVEAGALALDDDLATHVPDALASVKGVTLRTLLCHTSGLPLDIASELVPYAPGLDWPALAEGCRRTPLQNPPLTRVAYSNIGYGLLALAVEAITGRDFAAALRTLVLGPLRIEGYLGMEPPRPVAATADVRGPRAQPDLEPFNSRFYRSLALPWAGLLTNAAGALALVGAFAGRPASFLSQPLRAEAVRSQTGTLSGGFSAPLHWSPCPWGLGADLRGEKLPHWVPAEAGADSFGHSGASGCLAWYAPAADTAWVILGTRTADNGWLLRRSPAIGAAMLVSGEQPLSG